MNIYYERYINFLRKHNIYNEEVIKYIKNNSTHIDYKDDEQRDFIGCLYSYDNRKILKMHICIPYIDSDITTLINIHEYIHVFILYQHLNKKYIKRQDEEILPMLYEILYYLDNPSEELKKEIIKLNNRIANSDQIQYKIALESRKELLEYYQKEKPNFKKLQQKAKKLSKRYSK